MTQYSTSLPVSASATASNVADPKKKSVPRRSSLDGLRAVAVLMVMGDHAGFPGMALGWLGVEIFFVLSGFLITTLLISEHRKQGRISLPRFWGRRFLRLMPIYWLYIGCCAAAMVWFDRASVHTYEGWTRAKYVFSLWTYWVNYAPMDGIWTHQQYAGHLWSLAVEEQYYFIWPILLALLLRHTKRAVPTAWIIVVVVFAYRVVTPWHGPSLLLYTRGIGIFMGSAVALSFADGVHGEMRRLIDHTMIRSLWVGLTIILIAVLTYVESRTRLSNGQVSYYDGQLNYSVQPIACVFFAGIVLSLWHGSGGFLSTLLAWRPLTYLGRISYGMYLYHAAVLELVWKFLLPDQITLFSPSLKYGVQFALFVALTILIASLSFYLIERPFLRLKDRLR